MATKTELQGRIAELEAEGSAPIVRELLAYGDDAFPAFTALYSIADFVALDGRNAWAAWLRRVAYEVKVFCRSKAEAE